MVVKLRCIEDVSLVIGKINGYFEQGHNGNQCLADVFELSEQFTLQVISGKPCCCLSLCLQQIQDCFSLGQINATGKKGTLGELSRLGCFCTELEDELKDILQDEVGSVTVQLNHVLAGIGVGGMHVHG